MKNFGLAIVASLALALAASAASAAKAPPPTTEKAGIAGTHGIELPGTRKTVASSEIKIAQGGGPRAGRRGGAPRAGRGGGRPVARGGRRRGKIGTGGKIAIGAAILGAAIIAGQAAQADDGRGECRRWRRQCRNGSDRACWKFDNRC